MWSYLPPPNPSLYFDQVWALVRDIPSGKVATYGRISNLLPKPTEVSEEDYQASASRWVGLAMAACPEDVPWHRVVNSKGKISHPEAGRQKKRLIEEGVLFTNDTIALSEFEWRGAECSDEPQQGRLF